MRVSITCLLVFQCCIFLPAVRADDVKKTDAYTRIKASIDAVPAVNTHDHLRPFEQIGHRDRTEHGEGITLRSIWAGSYFPWIHPLEPWPEDGSFDTWWSKARHNFANARATSFYRYLLPAFRDLYGVDFDTITAEQARALNERIFENYKTDQWLKEVITKRANIELMVIDAHWARLDFTTHYPFTVALCNVTSLVRGFHPSEFNNPLDDPYAFAARHEIEIDSLDDYVSVLDRVLETAREAGAICMKNTLAYLRTLQFENVSKERAAEIFGRPRKELTARDIKDFEDFIMWRLAELSAKHDLPLQIHTGQARIQGSNPMLLVDLIEANPKTKFVLFHGGFPWVGETGVIAMRCRNVWIDSVWLPTLSYTMARRAYQEWLEAVPSNRIMWGSDTGTAEGIYGATEFTRRCLAEALAEKVIRGELCEKDALRIGRQIMRENALELFPQLKKRLWRK
ncbi:MAG: amidohydrolase family protein [Phycisphaerales bacterium]|nr:MAG: amidohydrolase family protein [Phycisphaerales bacterium]